LFIQNTKPFAGKDYSPKTYVDKRKIEKIGKFVEKRVIL